MPMTTTHDLNDCQMLTTAQADVLRGGTAVTGAMRSQYEAPAYVWANRRMRYLVTMLRGHRDHSTMYELAMYQFRGAGVANVRGHIRGKNNAAQIAALRYLLKRCPLAVTPGLLDVARRIGVTA